MTDDLDQLVVSATEQLLLKIQDSDIVVSLIPVDLSRIDIKIIIEIGACLFLNKPLFLAAPINTAIPQRLSRAADHVVYFDPANPDWAEQLSRDINDFSSI